MFAVPQMVKFAVSQNFHICCRVHACGVNHLGWTLAPALTTGHPCHLTPPFFPSGRHHRYAFSLQEIGEPLCSMYCVV
jgi:hypothetical protein